MNKKNIFIVCIVILILIIIVFNVKKTAKEEVVGNEITVEDEVVQEFYNNHPDFETGFEDMVNTVEINNFDDMENITNTN